METWGHQYIHSWAKKRERGVEPGTQRSTNSVLEDLVHPEEGEDACLVVGHPQLLRHGTTYGTGQEGI